MSNPDNLAVMDDGRVLIGEDTSKHTNNALWIYTPRVE
jgi:secreted PhoX family phosphatase